MPDLRSRKRSVLKGGLTRLAKDNKTSPVSNQERDLSCCPKVLSEFVVDAGAVGLMTGQQSGSCHVSRMLGIHLYIGQGVDHGGQHHIPALGRILIDTYFDRPEHIYLFWQGLKSSLETLGYSKTLGVCASELECYDMFYHCLIFLFGVQAFAGGSHFLIRYIVIVVHHLVDDAVGCELDDTVADGLDELVVVRRQQYIALE